MKPVNAARLDEAADLVNLGESGKAFSLVSLVLNDEPECWQALYLGATLFLRTERPGLALPLCQRLTATQPRNSDVWNQLGRCHQELGRLDEAERAFQRCLSIEPTHAHATNNIGLVKLQAFKPREAIQWLGKARVLGESARGVDDNESLARLALKEWREGWRLYRASLGSTERRHRPFDAPEWDGTPGKKLVIHGEQGIGDEVMFASCLPDVLRLCPDIVLETEPRLKCLFNRSFVVECHGTRYEETITWPTRHKFEAKISIGSLPAIFRNETQEFPGTPYLTADSERRAMTRALLDGQGKGLKIGLAWSGGAAKTGKSWRSVSLEQLAPLMAALPGAHFVSLQYKDAPEAAGHNVKHWPFLVQTNDYDDTAALVAELDAIVSVTTAVIHLAGALGKPTWCLVPDRPTWRYGADGDSMPWYSSVKLVRQRVGTYDLEKVAKEIECSSHSTT